jgi:hypothetical protein
VERVVTRLTVKEVVAAEMHAITQIAGCTTEEARKACQILARDEYAKIQGNDPPERAPTTPGTDRALRVIEGRHLNDALGIMIGKTLGELEQEQPQRFEEKQ